MNTAKKLAKVKKILKKHAGVVVAFSGGVDSTLLLKIAKEVLKNNVIAVTAVSSLHPKTEIYEAKKIAKRLKSTHMFFQSNEMKDSRFLKNTKNRCYFCKLELFKKLKRIANKRGFAVVEASIKSDLKDYRPGLRALRKLRIASPFISAGIDKRTVRIWARKYVLPNWSKPSTACLVSRIPYDREINKKILQRIEKAESYLKGMNLSQVRVRDHFPIARIEVTKYEFKIILKYQDNITRYFRKLGYKYVTLDLEGYRTGSLNR